MQSKGTVSTIHQAAGNVILEIGIESTCTLYTHTYTHTHILLNEHILV